MLWVSPTNPPVRLGVSPTAATPTGFYNHRFWCIISPHWNLGLRGLSCSLLVLPGLSAHKWGTTQSANCRLAHPSHQPPCWHVSCLSQLLVSTPLSSLNECLLFNSLVVRLPYSSIFWQFWLFLFLNLLLSFFWLCEGAKYIHYTSTLAGSPNHFSMPNFLHL